MSNIELNDLINTLKQDGVKAGEEEALKIKAKAEQEAHKILKDATSKAEAILKSASKEVIQERENLNKQLKLATRDFFLKVRQELTEVVALRPLKDAIGKEMNNPAFLKQLIQRMVAAYAEADVGVEKKSLAITIPAEMEKQFVHEWHQMMREGLASAPVLHLQKGERGFKLSFNGKGDVVVDDDAIMEALRPFLSEKFHSLLVEGR